MNLQRVTGKPFTCFCYKCNKRLYTAQDAVYYDPKGESYKAFYCGTCVDALLKELET